MPVKPEKLEIFHSVHTSRVMTHAEEKQFSFARGTFFLIDQGDTQKCLCFLSDSANSQQSYGDMKTKEAFTDPGIP